MITGKGAGAGAVTKIEFMRYFLHTVLLVCSINWSAFSGFGQDKAPHNLSLRAGAGNSISLKHFSQERTSLNLPGSSFVNLQLSTNLIQKNNKSLFVGLEMQDLNYYPTLTEKAGLIYVSVLVGKTVRVDVNQGLYLKYTGGLSLGTLANVSSSLSGNGNYAGGPAKNINFGAFNNLQVLFPRTMKNQNLDLGLGFDVALNGVPVYSNKFYPTYLKQNGFIQYGLSFLANYNFKRRL